MTALTADVISQLEAVLLWADVSTGTCEECKLTFELLPDGME